MKKQPIEKAVTSWLLQRISAVILVPLAIWFIYLCLNFASMLTEASYKKFIDALQNKFNLVGLVLFVTISLFHGYLGMKVILEDYIADKKYRHLSILFLKIFSIFIFILFAFCSATLFML